MSRTITRHHGPQITDADRAVVRPALVVARDALARACTDHRTAARDLGPAAAEYARTLAALRDLDAGHDLDADDLDAQREQITDVADTLAARIDSGHLPAREAAVLSRRLVTLHRQIAAHDADMADRAAAAERRARAARPRIMRAVPFDPSTV